MNATSLRLTLVLFLSSAAVALAVGVSPAVDANPHGIVGFSQQGCICHGATPSPDVRAVIHGIPDQYRPGETYTLTVSVEGGPRVDLSRGGHAGGFDLRATGGQLQIPRAFATDDILIQSERGGTWHDMTQGGHDTTLFDPWTWGEVSFGHAGANQRSWQVQWRPPESGAGNVTFTLAALAANGDHSNISGDTWSTTVRVSQEGEALPSTSSRTLILVVAAAAVAVVSVFAYRSLGTRRRPKPARRGRRK